MRAINIFRKLYSDTRLSFYKLIFRKTFIHGVNMEVRNRFNLNINGGELIIGKSVFFNNDCSINCQGKIEIGDSCLFGENIKIYDHNHVFKEISIPISKQGMKIGKVKIGDNCWIGSNSTVLMNVTIGNNVIIGANCVIYKSIPSNTVVKAQSKLIIQER